MKTIIVLIITAIVGVCVFSACTVLPVIAGALDPSTPPSDWAEKAALARLLKYTPKKLLSEEEKNRAASNICALKHLDKSINNEIFLEKSKKFCKLQKDDKIYFFKEAKLYRRKIETGYLLLRESKAIKHIYIERKYLKELKKSIPIVDRLH